jgi:AraC family transcriptional activator of pobA
MIELMTLKDAVALLDRRRVPRYVLLWCSAGEMTLVADESELQLRGGSVATVTSGQVHWVKDLKLADGLLLEFTYDFFCRTDADIELIFHNSLFCHFAMNEVIQLPEGSSLGNELMQIGRELAQKPYQYLVSVHSRLELILVEINRAKLGQGGKIYKPDALFLKFLEEVLGNFGSRPNVRDVAVRLRTTESRLNELSRLHTGRSAQSVIYGLVASEAKRLLTHEKLTVKETAFRLGFEDPYYFSNFFKKQTNLSPKAYRERFAM